MNSHTRAVLVALGGAVVFALGTVVFGWWAVVVIGIVLGLSASWLGVRAAWIGAAAMAGWAALLAWRALAGGAAVGLEVGGVMGVPAFAPAVITLALGFVLAWLAAVVGSGWRRTE